jgi:mycoredoxin
MAITLYCTAWCRDCRMAKEFLESNGVAYAEINIDKDPSAEKELLARVGKRAIPQMVIDGAWFQPYRPGQGLLYDELRQRLGLNGA